MTPEDVVLALTVICLIAALIRIVTYRDEIERLRESNRYWKQETRGRNR